jgi:alanyl-tRNA synthetase
MMTRRLYYDDSYLRRFTGRVVDAAAATEVYLDASAFYPNSGGQPSDSGTIGEAQLINVVDEGDRVRHIVDRPVEPGSYDCSVDWHRRFDHMQQHTGQHLLSAAFEELLQLSTLSFHLGTESVTIDLAAGALTPAQLSQVETRVNEIVFEKRPVTVSYHEATECTGLRKPPERAGLVRVVTIADYDRSACGGTHVASTAEIGPVMIRKLDKVRGSVRVEFACGLRALTRSRADAAALSQGLQLQSARLAESDKQRRKMTLELANMRGRELYASTPAGPAGARVHIRQSAVIDEALRAEAQEFVKGGGGVFIAACPDPPSILLAVSCGTPNTADATLKPLLEKHGGRGGGTVQLAQGSLPDAGRLQSLAAELAALFT